MAMQFTLCGIPLTLCILLSASGCTGIPWVIPAATAIGTVPATESARKHVALGTKTAGADRDTAGTAPVDKVPAARHDGAAETTSSPAPAPPSKEPLTEPHRTNHSGSSSAQVADQKDRQPKDPISDQNASAVPKSDDVRSADDDAWRDHLAPVILALEAHRGSPQADAEDATRHAVYLRLLHLLANTPQAVDEPVSGADATEQEFWRHYLAGLSLYLDRERMPQRDRRAALALAELREATSHLAATGTLEVRNLAFCRSVDSFGVYTKFADDQFKPDQEVLLYVEVNNFQSVRTPEGFVTSLEGTYQILDAAGQRVADHTFPLERETCQNRRRDYFIPYRMWLPKKIEPGTYTLQLTVQDTQAQKSGQASIPFMIKP